jgi:hypothetical protein
MDALFGLSVLAGIIAVLVLLGIGAVAAGTDSRPGFSEDKSHHSSFRSDI